MEKKHTIRVKDNIKIRIDKFLVNNFKDYSRADLQKLIISGKVKINNKIVSSHQKIKNNDEIIVFLPSKIQITKVKKEKIKLDIVYEDKNIAIINKPPAMVVHPTDHGGHMEKTLVNALLYHFGKKNLSDIGGDLRPGIVHRLDKDTSGLIIIAKNNKTHIYLVDILKKRLIEKKYIVLLIGDLKEESGIIEAPLIKAKRNWGKVIISQEGEGKEARTDFVSKNHFEIENLKLSLVEAKIITGRTHQIRVHFNAIGHPVAGDSMYGNKNANKILKEYGLNRQFLHAAEIKFSLPDGKILHIKKGLPKDLNEVLKKIELHIK